MKINIQSKFKKSVIAVAMSMALGSVVAQTGKSSIEMAGASISYTSNDSRLTLSIAGSNMDVVTVYGTSSINWDLPVNIVDGIYRYELSIVTPGADGKEESASTQRVRGTFEVHNGVIDNTPENTLQDIGNSDTTTDLSKASKFGFEKIAVAILDYFLPSAEAADLVTDNASYSRIYHKKNGVTKWYQVSGAFNAAHSGSLALQDSVAANYVREVSTGTAFNLSQGKDNFRVSTAGATSSFDSIGGVAPIFFDIHKNASNSFIADSSGDVSLADSSVFIDKSHDRIGIGTITPAQELDIASYDPAIILNDLDGTVWTLNDNANSGTFDITHKVSAGSKLHPFAISNQAASDTLQLLSTGVNLAGNSNSNTIKLGIGTTNPQNAIHIKRNSANIKIEDNSPSTAKRFQVQMRNNGGTGFLMTDTSAVGREWQFATLSNGSFTASYLGTGGPELQILNNGRVTMGPGSTTNFNLVSGGNLYIPHGSVTATNFITSSSHTVKKDFEKVNADDLMSKLQNLEVTKWRYKDPEVKGHHIGPMAEDFYKLFELGPDDKHVVATDMAGIALIAAKELQAKTDVTKAETVALKTENAKLKQQLEEKTSALKAENEKLQERLASLEKLVTTLASSTKSLDSSGDKVALK